MQPQQHRNSAHASITSFSPKRAFIRTGNAVMSQLKGSQDVALLLPSHCRIPGSPGRPRLRPTDPPSPIDFPRLLLQRGPPPRPSLGTHIPVSSHWNALLKGRRSTFNPAPAIQHDAQRAPVRTRPSRLGDAAGPKLKSLLKGTEPTSACRRAGWTRVQSSLCISAAQGRNLNPLGLGLRICRMG